jgi:FKBP-type peptidyl-prolyl cis-trans isomerase FkpA
MKEKLLVQDKWYDKTNVKIAAVIVIGLCIFGYFGYQYSAIPCKYTKKPNLTAISKDSIKLDCMENIANVTTGLVVEDMVIGTGAEIKSDSTVKMHYLGKLSTGEKFDSSYDRNEPFQTKLGIGKVIKGWDEGVPGMKVGGKRKLTIPSDLAYGERGIGPIPGGATLVFEIEAVELVK